MVRRGPAYFGRHRVWPLILRWWRNPLNARAKRADLKPCQQLPGLQRAGQLTRGSA